MCYTFQENLIVRNFLAFEGASAASHTFSRGHISYAYR